MTTFGFFVFAISASFKQVFLFSLGFAYPQIGLLFDMTLLIRD
jgi:hypothetical protein